MPLQTDLIKVSGATRCGKRWTSRFRDEDYTEIFQLTVIDLLNRSKAYIDSVERKIKNRGKKNIFK